MSGRAVERRGRSGGASAVGCALIVAWGLGCIFGDGGEGGDGFDLFPPAPPAGEEEWREDAEERREERDDPRSVNYRGDFEVALTGDRVSAAIDGSRLGEATFKHVSADLTGTPPHCQLTLADREPDERGAQGYVIVQVIGPDCDLEPGEHAVYGAWQEASERGDGQEGGVVIKAVQVNVETDALTNYYDYEQPEGTLEIVRVERGDLIQAYLEVVMKGVSVNDGEVESAEMSVSGGFGAVAAP